MLLCNTMTHLFLLYSMPLHKYTTMYLYISLLTEIWVVSSMGPLQLVLQRIFLYIPFSEYMYAYLLNVYLE